MPISLVFGNASGNRWINLFHQGLSLTKKDHKNGTPLHWACYYGCEQSAIYILALLPDNESTIND
jgi:ankyrin repeat protein